MTLPGACSTLSPQPSRPLPCKVHARREVHARPWVRGRRTPAPSPVRDILRASPRLLPARLRSRCSSGCLPRPGKGDPKRNRKLRRTSPLQADEPTAAGRWALTAGLQRRPRGATGGTDPPRALSGVCPAGREPGDSDSGQPPPLPYLPPAVPRRAAPQDPGTAAAASTAPPSPAPSPGRAGPRVTRRGRARLRLRRAGGREAGKEGEDGGGGARAAGGGAVPRAGRHCHRRRHRHRQGHRRRPAGARWARGGLRRKPRWGSGAGRVVGGRMEFEGPSGGARGLCCLSGPDGARGRCQEPLGGTL